VDASIGVISENRGWLSSGVGYVLNNCRIVRRREIFKTYRFYRLVTRLQGEGLFRNNLLNSCLNENISLIAIAGIAADVSMVGVHRKDHLIGQVHPS